MVTRRWSHALVSLGHETRPLYLSEEFLQHRRRIVLLPDDVERQPHIHIHDWQQHNALGTVPPCGLRYPRDPDPALHKAQYRIAIRGLLKSLFTTDTHFVVYMNANDPTPSMDLRSREALAPVFADLNKYDATTHFVGQSSILTLTNNRATGEDLLPGASRDDRRRQETTCPPWRDPTQRGRIRLWLKGR